MGDVSVRQELLVVTPEDTPCVKCDVDGGDMLLDLSFACGGGVEACFDGVVLGGQHSIGLRVLYRDAEVSELSGAVRLGMGDDVGSIRGGTEEDGSLGVCCM